MNIMERTREKKFRPNKYEYQDYEYTDRIVKYHVGSCSEYGSRQNNYLYEHELIPIIR